MDHLRRIISIIYHHLRRVYRAQQIHFLAQLFLSGGALLLRNFVLNIVGKEFVFYDINSIVWCTWNRPWGFSLGCIILSYFSKSFLVWGIGCRALRARSLRKLRGIPIVECAIVARCSCSAYLWLNGRMILYYTIFSFLLLLLSKYWLGMSRDQMYQLYSMPTTYCNRSVHTTSVGLSGGRV